MNIITFFTLLNSCSTDHTLSFSLNHVLAKSPSEKYSQSKTVVHIFYIHAKNAKNKKKKKNRLHYKWPINASEQYQSKVSYSIASRLTRNEKGMEISAK